MRIRHAMLSASASALAIMAAGQALGQDVDTVDEVVVTGIRASIQQSIETKRNANAVVDVLSAEDVGKFPDKNLAEALQRVPGVTINREFGEGERVSLRGLAPNLTRTLYNGHGLATADWFILDQQSATRSFNFLMLPSEIIGQTVVYKSPTADLEEGGVGGTVNVITRKPLDLEPLTVYASAQGAYTEMSDKWDPQFSGLVSWKNADETLGVLVAGVYQKRQIRRDAIEVLGYSNYTLNGQSLLVPALIGSALFQQERVRQGANFEVQWKPNDRVELALSGLYSKFDADNFNQNYMAWGSNALGSAGGTLTNATIQDDTVVAGTITSGPGGRAVVFDAIDRSALAETRNINFEAKLNPTEDWALRFQVGYTDASGDTESQPFAEFAQPGSFTYDLRGGLPKVSYGGGINPASPAGMIFDFASLHQITNDDSEFYAYADAERQLELGALSAVKFGVKYTDHERETDFQATTYGGFFMPLEASGCGGRCTAANFAGGPLPSDFAEDFAQPGALTSYWQVDRDKLQSIFYGLPASVRARVPNYPEIFSVQEKAFAGYVMGEFEGEGWRGNIGVRVINTEQTSTGYGTSLAATDPGRVSNAFGDFRLISVTREYTDVLPSANFTFDLTDDLILRFAAARVMGRPDFTDIAPRVSLNPGALSGAGGDPNIDPYRANQFDVSFEWYPRPQTMVAAALYLKDLQSFITDRPVTQTFGIETQTPNASLCTPAGGANPNLFNCQFTINRRANGGGGKLQGVELSVQAPIWNGFGVLGSYTYSDAELDSGEPLPGNSTHAFNLTAFYENDRLSARLAYAQRSEFFVTFDRATQLNQDGLKQLDASVVFNVTDQLALTFDAQNLTDEEIVQYAGDSFRPRGTYDYGRTYFVGARFRY